MDDDDRRGNWICMVNGQKFWPADTRSADFDPRVIACGLARDCRWGGQLDVFMPVAQHCVLVERLVRAWHGPARDDADAAFLRRVCLDALVHDASEGLGLRDLPTPIKKMPQLDGYRSLEADVMRGVRAWLGLGAEESNIVQRADHAVAAAEARDLRPYMTTLTWQFPYDDAMPDRVVPWDTYHAEAVWLARFNELTGAACVPHGARARRAFEMLGAPWWKRLLFGWGLPW